tara:strand:+ start:11696 stop:11971 length:276 start_codon:yes stop_codon:yes gene_type:complete
MQNILLTFHVMVCLVLLGLVLIQHGRGADQGLLSGGGAGSLFGAGGSSSFVVKVTVIFAVLFFFSSISLGYYQSHHMHQITNQVIESKQVN